jgi:hypothetical protein
MEMCLGCLPASNQTCVCEVSTFNLRVGPNENDDKQAMMITPNLVITPRPVVVVVQRICSSHCEKFTVTHYIS